MGMTLPKHEYHSNQKTIAKCQLVAIGKMILVQDWGSKVRKC